MHATERGQVTIPIAIRRRFAILPDTELDFVADGDQILLKILDERTPGERLIAHMRGKATGGMTTEEVMALTRGED
jgi:bifunctional DNA-binding transcriptional regulator/antitoxin component of YhaV-PrlF toxin-antitoxin module